MTVEVNTEVEAARGDQGHHTEVSAIPEQVDQQSRPIQVGHTSGPLVELPDEKLQQRLDLDLPSDAQLAHVLLKRRNEELMQLIKEHEVALKAKDDQLASRVSRQAHTKEVKRTDDYFRSQSGR